MTATIPERVVCPQCRAPLEGASACSYCGQFYPRLASTTVLLPNPQGHLELWRTQLGVVLTQANESKTALESQAAEPSLGDATRTRLLALAAAIAVQAVDVADVLGPALGGPLPPREDVGLPRGATDYISYLFRDWAWPAGELDENARAVAAIRSVGKGRALGRTLVLGAGACRLAYDLHVHCGGLETAVLDIDPFLLAMAERIIRGTPVDLTETSVNAPEIEPASRRWTLAAPAGPLEPAVFHFFLANGTEPPFLDQTFDTIVTPWFIDQVPTDLQALLRRLSALLVPGGRWINRGPLIYRPDMLPIARWYTRQEIFELAVACGFQMGAWESASQPYLVSPLTGRGLIENVLTFEAVRT